MCSQLIQNVNISLEICANVSGGLWEAAGALRARFGCTSGKVLGGLGGTSGKVRGRFGEGSGKVRERSGGASARPPCGHFYGILIIPLLEPSSEFAIKEKLQYFIRNMCKCVRGALGGRGGTSGKVRGRFGEGSGKVRGRFGTAAGEPAPDPPV